MPKAKSKGPRAKKAKKTENIPPPEPESEAGTDPEAEPEAQPEDEPRSPTPPPSPRAPSPQEEESQGPLQQDDLPDIAAVKRKAKKKKTDWKSQGDPNRLSTQQEMHLKEWLEAEENRFLYDKSHQHFLDTHKKNELWQAKATEMSLSLDRLITWFKSTRDCLSRWRRDQARMPSGSGAPSVSSRTKFVVDNFSFLNDHINRVGKKSGKLVSKKHFVTVNFFWLKIEKNIFLLPFVTTQKQSSKKQFFMTFFYFSKNLGLDTYCGECQKILKTCKK